MRIVMLLLLALSVLAAQAPLDVAAAQKRPSGAVKEAQVPVGKGGAQTPSPATLFPPASLAPVGEAEQKALREAAAAYGKKDYAKASAVLTPLAESGSARAAFSLGLMAVRGHGMIMSTETAEKWWIQSAKGGFPDAQYHLGIMYHQALRGARNPELIAHLWNMAAGQGQGDAMFGLGFMYRAGDGVAKNAKKSLKMFSDAAALGHPGAAYELGLMYKYGRGGIAKDAGKARTYLEKAAAAGVVQAQRELAKK